VNIKKIYSKNSTYQKFEVLKTNRNKRYKYREFLVEGVRSINEAVKRNWVVNSFLYPAEKPLSAWAKNLLSQTNPKINYALYNGLMDELSDKSDTSELLAIVQMSEDNNKIELSQKPILCLFDRPSNKGNLGTMLRSCDALGVEELIVTGHSVDIYDPEVIGASMGSFFKVPFKKLSNNSNIDNYLNELKSVYRNLKIIGTTAHNSTIISNIDMTTPVLSASAMKRMA
jgi:TrmH family RNA methyltransferase